MSIFLRKKFVYITYTHVEKLVARKIIIPLFFHRENILTQNDIGSIKNDLIIVGNLFWCFTFQTENKNREDFEKWRADAIPFEWCASM